MVFVKEIKDAKYKDFKSVKSEIKKKIIDSKKSELILERINQNWSEDINILAKNLNKTVNNASNFSFKTSNFSDGGNDPGATGFFFGLNKDKLSRAYVGNRGVFIFLKGDIISSEFSNDEVLGSKQQIINSAKSEFKLNVINQSKNDDQIEMLHMSF